MDGQLPFDNNTDEVIKTKEHMMELFDCKTMGEMKGYVGCKVKHDKEKRQIASMAEKLPRRVWTWNRWQQPNTLLEQGAKMTEAEEGTELEHEKQFKYRSWINELLHIIIWLRSDNMKAVNKALFHLLRSNEKHIKVYSGLCILLDHQGKKVNAKDKQ